MSRAVSVEPGVRQPQLPPSYVRASWRHTKAAAAAAALQVVLLLIAPVVCADTVTFTDAIPFTLSGTTNAAPGTSVRIFIENAKGETQVRSDGTWSLLWTAPLPTGTYDLRLEIGDTSEAQLLRVQLRGPLARQSGIETQVRFADPLPPEPSLQEMTDRWRIVPPPYELTEASQGRFDPYNQNILKGDRPIRLRDYAPERWRDKLPFMGDDAFLVLTGISDSLVESRTLPTPSGVSADRPGSFRFFGRDSQGVFAQNVILSADVFEGDTTFQPVRQRVKITLVANLNHVRVEENAILKPSPRRGTERTDGRLSLQELFYERKLRDLGPNFDFVSFRAGIQPFSSDFRGFIFSDTNLGFRLFGNWRSNRYQYNLAFFDRLEKDTNSGLNIFHELREQRVAVANLYWQDFLRPGYTQQFSIHHVRDEPSIKYDRNGNLVRPAPVGDAKPHSVQATYIGTAGLGHFGRYQRRSRALLRLRPRLTESDRRRRSGAAPRRRRPRQRRHGRARSLVRQATGCVRASASSTRPAIAIRATAPRAASTPSSTRPPSPAAAFRFSTDSASAWPAAASPSSSAAASCRRCAAARTKGSRTTSTPACNWRPSVSTPSSPRASKRSSPATTSASMPWSPSKKCSSRATSTTTSARTSASASAIAHSSATT
jgi:hypothetical protein